MKADLFIVQICDFLNDGDGHYRLHEPSLHLSRLPGVVVVDCHFYHRFLPKLVEAADVLVLPFVHNWDFFPTIEERRARGQITTFEDESQQAYLRALDIRRTAALYRTEFAQEDGRFHLLAIRGEHPPQFHTCIDGRKMMR